MLPLLCQTHCKGMKADYPFFIMSAEGKQEGK